MKYLFLFLVLVWPLVAAPFDEKEVSKRIEANQSAEDDADSLSLWESALLELEARNFAIEAAEKAQTDLGKLDELPQLLLPDLPTERAELVVFENALAKVKAEIEIAFPEQDIHLNFRNTFTSCSSF